VTQSAYTLRPSLRSALLAFVVHHNPFYLLSALSMLAGCYALNSGLAARTGELQKLLLLLGVLNGYEAILIGLGLYLIRRRGILRDGRTLLLLEAPFLVDLGFINAEVGSNSVGMGSLLNLLILALALLKMAIALRVLWGRLPGRLFGSIAVQLAVLFLLPSAFTRFEHHHPHADVTPGEFYGAWWVVGAMLILYELQCRFIGAESGVETNLQRLVRRLYLALPLMSILLHLSLLHWVYRVAFVGGDLAPVLIGVAFVIGRWSQASHREVRLLRALLPAAAIVLTAENSPAWIISLGHWVELTPTLLMAGIAYVTYVYCFFIKRALKLLAGAAAAILLIVFGPTLEQLWALVIWGYQRCLSVMHWLGGRSAIEWGVAEMGSAFAFLALGAGISLRKEAPPVESGP
jgi:hypothetical protein